MADRQAVCAVLNTLWPLVEQLPSRLEGVGDGRVPETLFAVAREALEAQPRQVVLKVVGARMGREAAAAGGAIDGGADPAQVVRTFEADWPVGLDRRAVADLADGGAAAALPGLAADVLERRGWEFVHATLRRQMERTVGEALPRTCDLAALIGWLDSRWPLGQGVTAAQLESQNYGVIEDRLRRVADDVVERDGFAFVERAAEHRVRRVVARAAEELGAEAWGELPRRLRDLLPVGVAVETVEPGEDLEATVAALLETHRDDFIDGLILQAVEEAAAQAVVAAHRRMAAGGEGEEEDEEDLEFGDLRRLIERLGADWALGEVLNPWELERLTAAEMRREMVDLVRGGVRNRGMEFVTATARQRIGGMVSRAVEDHYSLTGLCNRLNREFELPGVFSPDRCAEAADSRELLALLNETAEEELGDQPDRIEHFRTHLRVWVDEGYNPRRLCERLNRELQPERRIKPEDLAEVEGEAAATLLLGLLEDVEEAATERFVVEAVAQHLQLDIEEALARYYNVRDLSAAVGETWPLQADAVRASKLKGWAFREIGGRLKELLHDALRREEWRFLRRFVLRLLERDLTEVLDETCPSDVRRSDWDLGAMCDELALRWPLAEALEPSDFADRSRQSLEDELLGVARRSYAQEERAFVRRTARHRFAQQVEQMRLEHYSLGRACRELNQSWRLGEAFGPPMLGRLRALGDRDPAAVEGEIGRLVEPLLEAAEAALLQDALERRIADSVDDVLLAHYNTTRLLRALVGRWPLPRGGWTAGALRAKPYRDMVEQLRLDMENARPALLRRLVFNGLRSTVTEADLERYLPADRPEAWRLGDLLQELGERLPPGEGLDPAGFAAGLWGRALARDVASAAAAVRVEDHPRVRAGVLHRAARDLDELGRHEGRPQALAERLGRRWPLGDQVQPAALVGQGQAVVRGLLLEAVGAAFDQDPAEFLAEAARRWIAGAVEQTVGRMWPSGEEPGPWDLARICESLNARWGSTHLLHPGGYKGLEREELSAALIKDGWENVADLVPALVRELVAGWLEHGVAEAVREAVGDDGAPWDLESLAAALEARWPEDTVPCPTTLESRLTPRLAHRHLVAELERREPELVAHCGEEPVRLWLAGHLERALDEHCSIRAVCAELERRWPLPTLDASRLTGLAYHQVREALIGAAVEAARQGGDGFVLETARRRLAADVDEALADHGGELRAAELRPICASLGNRWGLMLDHEALAGHPADAVRERLLAAAVALPDEEVRRTFHFETVRRRLRQSVEEAQREHCNPEIVADRWDQAAFVAALERQWPIEGQLDPERLRGLTAPDLYERARQVLQAAFDADEAQFVRDTTRLRLGLALRDALAEHADLGRLVGVLNQHWPGETRFEVDSLRRERLEELPGLLADLVRSNLHDGPDQAIEPEVQELVDRHLPPDGDEFDATALLDELRERWAEVPVVDPAFLDEAMVAAHLRSRLAWDFAADPRAFVRAVTLEEVPRQLERRLMLDAIDTNWCNHLEAMDYLREGINLRGYGQTDPFIAYRKEGRQMFENMLGRVRETVIGGLFETTDEELVEMHQRGRLGLQVTVEFQNVQEMAQKAEDLIGASGQRAPRRPGDGGDTGTAAALRAAAAEPTKRAPVVITERVGRNDPCPCGSGKKYKHCCGRRS